MGGKCSLGEICIRILAKFPGDVNEKLQSGVRMWRSRDWKNEENPKWATSSIPCLEQQSGSWLAENDRPRLEAFGVSQAADLTMQISSKKAFSAASGKVVRIGSSEGGERGGP